MQGKAEDAGILSYVKDDNAAMCSVGHRTCSDICLVCYKYSFKFLSENPLEADLFFLACSKGIVSFLPKSGLHTYFTQKLSSRVKKMLRSGSPTHFTQKLSSRIKKPHSLYR